MEAGARRVAHLLKYDGLTSLAEPMARLMVDAARVTEHDVVVPVPLHWRRDRLRGYNQAHELARCLAREIDLPMEERAVRRQRDTQPLVKAMGRDERRNIMLDAFEPRGRAVEGSRVLLVDDVMTTGATLDACARALLTGGAASVACLAWARAD